MRTTEGFTLIEMSIVLVIIGLIVGGVLVGQDLIRAAAVRAQISQIEKYNTAVNTFRGKYNAIPGDMNGATCSQFGLSTPAIPCQFRGMWAGTGDGNGILDAPWGTFTQVGGEVIAFWEDLSSDSAGHLIAGTFNTGDITNGPNGIGTAILDGFLPHAVLGDGGTYVYVFELGGINYYGLAGISQVLGWTVHSYPTLTVRQAFSIDSKVDDGLPTTGRVQEGRQDAPLTPVNDGNPGGGATYCYDSTTGAYQTGTYPNSVACALIWQFQ